MRGARLSFPAYDTPIGRAIEGHLKSEWVAGPRPDIHNYNCDDDVSLNALILQALMTVNRLEMLPQILAHQKQGTPVILDRYWASAMVYGAADGLDPVWLRTIHASLPEPDAWLYLNVSPEEGIRRRPERRDRYERDGLMAKRRELYRELWAEHSGDRRWQVVDGHGTIEDVQGKIVTALGAAGVLA